MLIPVWHGVTREQVKAHSLSLAARLALNTQGGLLQLARDIKEAVKPPFRSERRTPAEVDTIVTQFVINVRNKNYKSNALSPYIDNEAMDWLRMKFTKDDTDALIELMWHHEADSTARMTAASVLLGRRIKDAPTQEYKRVRASMERYYDTHAENDSRAHRDRDWDSWLVPRAIARALAGTGNGDSQMLDWIDRLEANRLLLEKNLEISDKYYGGPESAVKIICRSVLDKYERYPSGRLWEVFYLGYRASQRDPRVLGVLKRCLDGTRDIALRQISAAALKRLS